MAFQKRVYGELYDSMATELRQRIPDLTDFAEGSVVRSLLEAFSYEMGVLYQQMDLVYQAGFVDTASGASLDRVVAVLGITRNDPDFAVGEVTFERDPGSDQELSIPVGTLVTTDEKADDRGIKRAYLTREEGRLRRGDTTVDVKVQAAEPGGALISGSETVVLMPRPVPGVKTVHNRKPIRFQGRERETDEELRERAKKALLASGRASSISIENALLALPGVRGVRVVGGDTAVEASPSPDDHAPDGDGNGSGASAPPREVGLVRVYVDGLTRDNQALLRERVDAVRAAGIYVVLAPASPINVQMVVKVEVDPQLSREERLLLEGQVRDAVYHYVDRLRMGEPLVVSQLTREALNVPGVRDLTRLEVVTFREAGVHAGGRVRLRVTEAPAGAVDGPSVLPQTELTTATGQRFLVDEDDEVRFARGAVEASVRVRALTAGREGELPRTGSAAGWQPLRLGDWVLEPRNDEPIRLHRAVAPADAKRIEVAPQERFVPDSIRLASEDKDLEVQVQILLRVPGAAAQRAMLEEVGSRLGALREAAVEAAGEAELDADALRRLHERIGAWVDDLASEVAAGAASIAVDPTPALAREVVELVERAVRALGSGAPVVQETLRAEVHGRIRDHLAASLDAWAPRVREGLRESLAALLARHAARFPTGDFETILREAARREIETRLATQRQALQDANADAAAALTAAARAEAAAIVARDRVERPPEGADAAKLRKAQADAEQALAAANARVEETRAAPSAAQAALDARVAEATQSLADAEAGLTARVAALRERTLSVLQGLASPEALAGALADRFSADAFDVGLRLRSVSFEGTVQADAASIEPSFVERAVPAAIFLYDRTLPLQGRLHLVLPLTAPEEEKRRVRAEVRQRIADYVDGLGPEDKVDLRHLRALAEEHERVLRASFELPAALRGRVDRDTLTVLPFEKVLVTETAPEITA